MKYDATTAESIALKGMAAMQTAFTEGKYTVELIGEDRFAITKENRTRYEVSVYINTEDRSQSFGICDCPFCQNGDENQVCKHILFCLDLVEFDQVWRRDDSDDLRSVLTRANRREVAELTFPTPEEDAYYDALEAQYGMRPYSFSTGPEEIVGDARLYKMFG